MHADIEGEKEAGATNKKEFTTEIMKLKQGEGEKIKEIEEVRELFFSTNQIAAFFWKILYEISVRNWAETFLHKNFRQKRSTLKRQC